MSMEASDPSNSDGLVLGKHFVAVSSSLEKFLEQNKKLPKDKRLPCANHVRRLIEHAKIHPNEPVLIKFPKIKSKGVHDSQSTRVRKILEVWQLELQEQTERKISFRKKTIDGQR